MIVRNWMRAHPMVVDSDILLSEAKRILTENNLHGLPVVDHGRLRAVHALEDAGLCRGGAAQTQHRALRVVDLLHQAGTPEFKFISIKINWVIGLQNGHRPSWWRILCRWPGRADGSCILRRPPAR